MPPSAPSTGLLNLVIKRAMSSGPTSAATKPRPSKDHLVHAYASTAFPLGYAVASAHAGIKKKAGALDIGILVSTSSRPCSAAACVTRNVFKAAPVAVTTELLQRGKGRVKGFVVNSGCANAVTGQKGLENAWKISEAVSRLLPDSSGGGEAVGVLPMSTGVIGQHLPIDSITPVLPTLTQTVSDSPRAWLDLARAFMTTDTFPKLRCRTFALGDRLVRLVGIDKGAGMIAPSMGPPHATLLGVIATDAAVEPAALQSALQYAVDRSFNNITVDGDMSTNDTILALANGQAGRIENDGRESAGESMQELTESSEEYGTFKEELRSFAEELAQLVVRDGEGATKFVTVRVKASGALAAKMFADLVTECVIVWHCQRSRKVCGIVVFGKDGIVWRR